MELNRIVELYLQRKKVAQGDVEGVLELNNAELVVKIMEMVISTPFVALRF